MMGTLIAPRLSDWVPLYTIGTRRVAHWRVCGRGEREVVKVKVRGAEVQRDKAKQNGTA